MKFCWVTINVKDMEESLFFYQEIIGLKISRRFKPDQDREIVFLGNEETKVELIYNSKKQNISFGEDISLGFEVNSIEEITKKLENNNIKIYAGPFQPNPSLRFIFVLDPNGLKIQFVENR
ncbi:MAG: VOC family protein [Atribacterota bacterium]|nr:VOC family protein [Atribacterota bacterium]